MSIVKAINELSGKEAVTIEDAIRNVELGGDAGYEYSETTSVLFEGEVTVEASSAYGMPRSYVIAYSALTNANSITVTMDQKSCVLSRVFIDDGGYMYGLYKPEWHLPFFDNEHPCAVFIYENGTTVFMLPYSASETTAQLKIEGGVLIIDPDFKAAVRTSVPQERIFTFMVTNNGDDSYSIDTNYAAILEAYDRGAMIFAKKYDNDLDRTLIYTLTNAAYNNFFAFNNLMYWLNNEDQWELASYNITVRNDDHVGYYKNTKTF